MARPYLPTRTLHASRSKAPRGQERSVPRTCLETRIGCHLCRRGGPRPERTVRTVRWTERPRTPGSCRAAVLRQSVLTPCRRDHYPLARLTGNRRAPLHLKVRCMALGYISCNGIRSSVSSMFVQIAEFAAFSSAPKVVV